MKKDKDEESIKSHDSSNNQRLSAQDRIKGHELNRINAINREREQKYDQASDKRNLEMSSDNRKRNARSGISK